MGLTPKNDSGGGMIRSMTASTLTRDRTIEELKADHTVSGVEIGRRELGLFYLQVSKMDRTEILNKFCWFINEREEVRRQKEAGMPAPWTCDEIIKKTKFTNIFRQDDRVSKFIYDKVGHLKGEVLFYNLLLSRLINRTDVLSKILPTTPDVDLSYLMADDAPVLNAAAYQLSPNLAKYNNRATVREVVILDTKKKYLPAYAEVLKGGTVSEVSERANVAYGKSIPFAMFQVVADWEFLIGGMTPSSTVRVGQGAKAVVDLLLSSCVENVDYAETCRPGFMDLEDLTKEVNDKVERVMSPLDVEHAACEFRKYLYRQDKNLSRYSYKPNSMGIGK